MVQNDEFLTFKFVFINEGESNRKLSNQIESCWKCLQVKIYERQKKKTSPADLIKKKPDVVCCKDAHVQLLSTKSFYHGLKQLSVDFFFQVSF